MALVNGSLMSSKFKGSLVGSLLGDCLGCPYEDRPRPHLFKLQEFFDNLEGSPSKTPQLQYTDDTAMSNCIAESLIALGKVDAHDLAKRFVEKYFNDTGPNRGYGINVRDVFVKLRNNKYKDPLGPAREQFDGTGSYGNGGAMRIAPVALFFHGQGTHTLGSMALQVTQITHTHPNGCNGAILQCLAIDQALSLDPKQPIDAVGFLEQLIAKMQVYEKVDDKTVGQDGPPQPYVERLQRALKLLQTEKSESKEIKAAEVVNLLGSGIAAMDSVPTAIYCFLRAHQGEIPNIQTSNPLRRTHQFAISLGGDTDTIACMAGALSGAFLGYDHEYFNRNIMKKCEDMELVKGLAKKLYSKSCGQRG